MKTEWSGADALGVVGGMGPLASAEFLKTIYECSLGRREQDSPRVFLYSDPTVPDRTEALLRGSYEELLESLTTALRRLHEMGASRTVICCVTIHGLLPRLPPALGERIISLVEVIFAEVERSRKRHLLVCTTGTRELGIFEAHPRWPALKEFIVLPEEGDQAGLHEWIYRVKLRCDPDALVPFLESLLVKYGVDSFIAGCTEMHLLARRLLSRGRGPSDIGCIDPLTIIARELSGD